MSLHDLLPLSPLLIVALAALGVMVTIAVRRAHGFAAGLTVIGFLAAAMAVPLAARSAPRNVTSLLIVDAHGLVFMTLICAAGAAIALLAYDYWRSRPEPPEEFYVLLLVAGLGAMVLVESTHFASLFLGLETLTISLYALVAYRRDDRLSLEGGVKYLILAAASSAFLLFGMALVYSQAGTMRLADLAAGSGARLAGPVASAALAMVIAGLGFKLALVPFHLWTPDVYQGAPAPTTAFVATVSKGSVFALLLRYFGPRLAAQPPILTGLAALAVLSMMFGNVLALRQTNVKRMLAYSSIAHMGYVLVALLASGPMAVVAVVFYLATYFIATIGAFGIVGLLADGGRDADRLADFRGLAWRRPLPAAVLSAMLFSLAGIPITAGFVGKFYVLAAGIGAARWWLVMTLIVASAVGVYYYLRVILVMYFEAQSARTLAAPAGDAPAPPARRAWTAGLSLTAASIALVWLGVYPAPLIRWIEAAAGGLM